MLRNNSVSLFGRDGDIATIADHLDGGGVLLVGPRRIGKTELLKHLRDQPPREMVAVRVDLEGLTDVTGAVARIRDAFDRDDLAPRKILDRLKELRRVEVAGVLELDRGMSWSGGEGQEPWDALEDLIEAALEKMKKVRRLALFLDEVPWWLDSLRRKQPGDDEADDGDARVRQVLAQLRYLRQREGIVDKLRVVFTGSVGLAGLASGVGASAELNDLVTHELRGLAEPDGMGLFESEVNARGVDCTDGASREAHRVAGGSPHWIKQIAAKIPSRRETPVDEAAIAAAIEDLLSPRMRHLFEDEGNAHLHRRHGARAPMLKAMLSAASASDAGVPRSTLITAGLRAGLENRGDAERALMQLADEFYLNLTEDRFAFQNPLFRRWWERFGHWR